MQIEVDENFIKKLREVKETTKLLKSMLKARQDLFERAVPMMNNLDDNLNDILYDLTHEEFYHKK